MDGAGPGATYQAITVKPYSPTIGAEIGNIDLSKPLSDLELTRSAARSPITWCCFSAIRK